MRVRLRPLNRRDLNAVARWLEAAHVQAWWRDQHRDPDHVEAKYGPRIDGTSPFVVFVVEADDSPVGLIQYCPADEYGCWPRVLGLQDTVVVDGLIGDPMLLQRGVATAALTQLIEHAFDTRSESGISAATRVENSHSRAVLERCGFALAFQGPLVEDDLPPHAVYVRWRTEL